MTHNEANDRLLTVEVVPQSYGTALADSPHWRINSICMHTCIHTITWSQIIHPEKRSTGMRHRVFIFIYIYIYNIMYTDTQTDEPRALSFSQVRFPESRVPDSAMPNTPQHHFRCKRNNAKTPPCMSQSVMILESQTFWDVTSHILFSYVSRVSNRYTYRSVKFRCKLTTRREERKFHKMRGMRAGQATRISVRVHACDLHALALVNAVVSSSCLDIVLWVPVAVKDNHLPYTHTYA